MDHLGVSNPLPFYGNTAPAQRPECDTPLSVWLKAHGVSKFALARKLGCDPKMVGLWASGRVMPSLVYAYKLAKETANGVPAAAWLGTELGKLLWNNGGVDWDRLQEQRKAERIRNRPVKHG